MKILKYLTIAVIPLIVSGCFMVGGSERLGSVDHYIGEYLIIQDAPELIITAEDVIKTDFKNTFTHINYSLDRKPRDQFAAEMGDVDFTKITGIKGVERLNSMPDLYSMYPIITHINIYSDAMWDEKHEAGESLDDCFSLTYYSFAPYIDSRYKKSMQNSMNEPITKSLSQLEEMDLRLVNYTSGRLGAVEDDKDLIWFAITSPTTNPEPQVLTFEWTMHTGEVYTGEIEYAPSQMSF